MTRRNSMSRLSVFSPTNIPASWKTSPTSTTTWILTKVLEDIKACYHWRWGIEISFRYLKHANGLLYFHSKKPEFLKQEIYANLILYNFGIFLANEAAEENLKKKRKKGNKYNYEIDFSSALKTARKFFVRRDSHKHVDIIKLMMKYVHAVKIEFRQFDRCLFDVLIFSIFTSQDQEISHFQIPKQEIEHEAKWHCLVLTHMY